jgi:type VI secretion system protein ImpJ
VGASSWLVKALKDIRDSVASRGRQLEEYKDPKEFQTPLLALYALNRHIPLLSQLCESGQIHPWTVYSELRQLVGELSTFSVGVFATGERQDGSQALPAYDHEDLGTCFSQAQSLIGRLLEAILTGPEHLIRLLYDGTYYSGTIPQEVFGSENKYWLLLQTTANTKAVLEAIEHLAKLGAPDSLPALVARAIPGIGLKHHPLTPSGLPQRPDTHYFEIDTTHRLWSDVVRSGSLSLYWDPPPPDLTAEVVITED